MSRLNTVSQAFLRWRRSAGSSRNETILSHAASMCDGTQVSEDELREVIDVLVRRGLVTGPTSLADQLPDPAQLTDQGVICVVDHEGDVQKWTSSNRPGSIDQSTNVGGQGNQVVAHSSNVQQNQHTQINNNEVLREVAAQALAGLDEYEIGDEDADDVRRAAQRALDETAQGEPEPNRLKRLATNLWAALLAFANTAAGTTFAQQLRDLLLPLVNLGAA
ncbi:hypothetical protein I4I84_06560 [Pseudonocardia sp. KRD-182]|uniref:hypothetical protein n=1 Tax=Pseudonocardia oceani TaxID=2792013 RepID=UPI001C4A63F8|nr:hypothetical protein [Pseudonocardia oceani]MBW0108398.1 hypothetical protein [Pseudonocardia oceani]